MLIAVAFMAAATAINAAAISITCELPQAVRMQQNGWEARPSLPCNGWCILLMCIVSYDIKNSPCFKKGITDDASSFPSISPGTLVCRIRICARYEEPGGQLSLYRNNTGASRTRRRGNYSSLPQP